MKLGNVLESWISMKCLTAVLKKIEDGGNRHQWEINSGSLSFYIWEGMEIFRERGKFVKEKNKERLPSGGPLCTIPTPGLAIAIAETFTFTNCRNSCTSAMETALAE